MFDDAVPVVTLAACGELNLATLTPAEQRLILHYRKVKASAQATLVDLAEQWTKTLPAERPLLRLVGPAD